MRARCARGSVFFTMAAIPAGLPVRSYMTWAPSRALSMVGFRASNVAGIKKGLQRIRPAVGDQRGGITESNTKESDSDWIKIQDYVATLNPRILGEAQDALNRKKWKGEGVTQQTFEAPCVVDIKTLSVVCSSDEVVISTASALGAMANAEARLLDNGGTSVQVGSVEIKLGQMPGWVQSLRKFRAGAHVARLTGVELASAFADADAAAAELKTRELAVTAAADGSLTMTRFQKAAGLSESVRLGFSKTVDVLPAVFSIVQQADAGATGEAAETRVKEVVLGASWEEHAACERDLDRLCGTRSRVSLGVWKPPQGPLLRLVPTDNTGLKTIVLYTADLEAAQERVKAAGLKAQQFPGYWSVLVGGLDLRLTEKEEAESFYEEVRWEVEDSSSLASAEGKGGNVSCVGAITHGLAKSASSGALGKKLRE